MNWDELVALGIGALAAGGISLITVLGLGVALVTNMIKMKRQQKITKDIVEDAFKKAVLPNDIKLDVSGKLMLPLKAGFDELTTMLNGHLAKLEEQNKLCLAILSQFTHKEKLPIETQNQINSLLADKIKWEVKL